MKRTRHIGGITLALLLCLVSITSAWAAVPSQWMDAFYVNDFAGVITTEDQNTMLAQGEALDAATGAQVILVTTNFFDGMTDEEYGYQIYTTWKIGQEDDQNGVVILLGVGERAIHITVGEDLESKLPPSVTGAYIDDYAIPHLSQGSEDYSKAMTELYNVVVNKVASIYGVSLGANGQAGAVGSTEPNGTYVSGNSGYTGNEYDNGSFGGFGMDVIWMIVGLVVVVAVIAIVIGLIRSAGNASGCLFGWMLGRGSRPYRRRSMWMPPPPPPRGGGGPRPRPPAGRSPGSFGGGGGFGGGGRSGGGSRPSGGSRPTGRPGGGGGTRGGGAGRKF